MLVRVLFGIVLFWVVEVWLLVWLAGCLGWGAILALVIVSAAIGAGPVWREGSRRARLAQESFINGQLCPTTVLDAPFFYVAAGLLAFPGVLTDLAGIALLFAPVRRALGRSFVRRIGARFASPTSPWPDGRATGDKILDAKVIDVESNPAKSPPR